MSHKKVGVWFSNKKKKKVSVDELRDILW